MLVADGVRAAACHGRPATRMHQPCGASFRQHPRRVAAWSRRRWTGSLTCRAARSNPPPFGSSPSPQKQQQQQPPPQRTLYSLLGVDSTASPTELRAAYRRAARRLHPDANAAPEAVPEFRRIRAAYELLADAPRRRQYDSGGAEALGPEHADLRAYLLARDASGAASGPGSGAGSGDDGNWEEDEKGQRGGSAKGVRGRDVHTVLGLLLSEAARGAEREVSYKALAPCEACEGTGQPGTPPRCHVCGGSGRVLRSQYAAAAATGSCTGVKVVGPAPCPACGGVGSLPQPPCARCGGRGRCRSMQQLSLRVPAGVEAGSLLRVRGAGSAGRGGGPAGDLLVRVEVYPAANLRREGDDLHSDLDVDVFVAVAGGSVGVDTVRGRRLLEVPPGAQPGDVLRLHGAGVARAAGSSASCANGGGVGSAGRGGGGGGGGSTGAASSSGRDAADAAAAAHVGGVVRGDHCFRLRVVLPRAQDLCAPSRQLLQQLAAVDSTLRGRGAAGGGGGGGAAAGSSGGGGGDSSGGGRSWDSWFVEGEG